MAYPEPIPVIKGKDAKKFDEKLKEFSLTEDQVKRYTEMKDKLNND